MSVSRKTTNNHPNWTVTPSYSQYYLLAMLTTHNLNGHLHLLYNRMRSAQSQLSREKVGDFPTDAGHRRGEIQLGVCPVLPCWLLDLAIVCDLKTTTLHSQPFGQSNLSFLPLWTAGSKLVNMTCDMKQAHLWQSTAKHSYSPLLSTVQSDQSTWSEQTKNPTAQSTVIGLQLFLSLSTAA